MLRSMTGFGRVEQTLGDKVFLIEIKSLNGKQMELQLKIPTILKSFEFDLRNMLQEKLQRGTIDCFVTLKQFGSAKPVTLNTELLRTYYKQVSDLATDLHVSTENLLGHLLRIPEVFSPSADVMSPQEFDAFRVFFTSATVEVDKHRIQEGSSIEKDLRTRIRYIMELRKLVEDQTPARALRIREEINSLLKENVPAEKIDINRLEQELIYYMEKIDINEEQVRLQQHCSYFLEVLNGNEISKGKKLSFILQEIGREINTTGSKAYDAGIQKLVVQMKDELEKAKEQVLNVL